MTGPAQIQSEPLGATAPGHVPATGTAVLPPPRPSIKVPLPSHGAPFVQHFVARADADIAAGRYECALDDSLAALAEAPDSIPLALRHAELLLATHRPTVAGFALASIRRLMPLVGAPGYLSDLERLTVHASPTPEGLLRLAREAIATERADLLDLYAPAALALPDGPTGNGRLELVRHWARLTQNPAARVALVAELASAGKADEARAALARLPRDLDPLLAARLVPVAARLADPAEWWLADRCWQAVEREDTPAAEIVAAFQTAAARAEDPATRIQLGLLVVAGGENAEGREILLTTRPPDLLHAYAALHGTAIAASNDRDDETAAAALARAAQVIGRPELAAALQQYRLVPGVKGLAELGAETADRLIASGNIERGVELIEKLVAAFPGNAVLAARYADLLNRSGQSERALARLTQLLAHQEQQGEPDAAIQTIRAILQLTPCDLRLRERLVQEQMQRGRLPEAIEERCDAARALAVVGRTTEALEQLKQALQVASMAGSWDGLERIFSLVVEIAPNDIDFRHRAVTSAIEHGRLDDAVRHLWDIVRIATTAKEADETIAALHQIIALAPADTDAYHKLGETLAAIGEFQQAERVYRRLRLLLPDDPGVRAKQAALAALAQQAS